MLDELMPPSMLSWKAVSSRTIAVYNGVAHDARAIEMVFKASESALAPLLMYSATAGYCISRLAWGNNWVNR